ncbi:hypothetical protein E2720_14325 [Salmonella enterica]|nr:hypothetical protein [Salmonella enterica]EAT7736272.1 hypothetical protein [Salmonella enterica]
MKATNRVESFNCSSVALASLGRIALSPLAISACGGRRHNVIYRYPSSGRYLLDALPAINKRYSGAVIYCCNNNEEVDHV